MEGSNTNNYNNNDYYYYYYYSQVTSKFMHTTPCTHYCFPFTTFSFRLPERAYELTLTFNRKHNNLQYVCTYLDSSRLPGGVGLVEHSGEAAATAELVGGHLRLSDFLVHEAGGAHRRHVWAVVVMLMMMMLKLMLTSALMVRWKHEKERLVVKSKANTGTGTDTGTVQTNSLT